MTGHIIAAGLGPAGPDLVTRSTLDAIAANPHRWVRTGRHPAASVAQPAATFDHVYAGADRLDDVYPTIVELLLAAAGEHGEILYLVPGSPVVAERTVELLQEQDDVAVTILPAMSFVDLAWARLGIDPVASGVRIIDGRRFATEAAGADTAMLVAQCDSPSVLSEIKLAVEVDDPPDVTVLQRLGTEDEWIGTVRWADLDRTITPDHLTSLWVPPLAAPVAAELQRFADLVATLRRECPWDREQTHQSLTRHLVEESYEVLEAIDRLDDDPDRGFTDLREELGDLLFQVFFHATLATESGEFTLAEVAREVHDKLVLRHPHVFADVAVDGTDDVVANWEAIKKREKGRESVFDGIPKGMPALLRAQKVLRKADAADLADPVDLAEGTDPADLVSCARSVVEHPDPEAVGALLLAVVAHCRRAGVDPEESLRRATDRLENELRAREGHPPRTGG